MAEEHNCDNCGKEKCRKTCLSEMTKYWTPKQPASSAVRVIPMETREKANTQHVIDMVSGRQSKPILSEKDRIMPEVECHTDCQICCQRNADWDALIAERKKIGHLMTLLQEWGQLDIRGFPLVSALHECLLKGEMPAWPD
ncbi:MAG: hypothetical protein PHN44_01255 [Candidatus Marinimicrobia bacterium]|nr:hypothetical protein [Candidatus Neomarinimicrobiota bacterium]MDD5539078.1 hypothetical protein [Candidatus Neomarinimicrobiota bacterium]